MHRVLLEEGGIPVSSRPSLWTIFLQVSPRPFQKTQDQATFRFPSRDMSDRQ